MDGSCQINIVNYNNALCTPKASNLHCTNRAALGAVYITPVLNQRVMFLKCSVESLAVCMPHVDKQDLSPIAERQRLRCAWAFKSERQFCHW